ncbi:MAG TPA: hypothetical protein VIJ23_05345 [Mycobacterium sp.]
MRPRETPDLQNSLTELTGVVLDALHASQRVEYLLTQGVLGTHPRRDRGVDRMVQQLLAARYLELLRSGEPLPSLMDTESTFFSQNGEDGVLLYLLTLLGHGARTSAEICAGDGVECCTANLIINHSWNGLLVDGDSDNVRTAEQFYANSRQQWFDPPVVRQAWITADSVAEILTDAAFDEALDLLVIDIDGMDFWIWKALDRVRPRIVVTEVNPGLGHESLTLAYQSEFVRPDNIPFAGTSLPAMVGLGRTLGYTFVGTERFGINAFFVRDDLVPDGLPLPSFESVLATPSVRRSAARIAAHLAPHRGALKWVSEPV